jgi:hypothetical protein
MTSMFYGSSEDPRQSEAEKQVMAKDKSKKLF